MWQCAAHDQFDGSLHTAFMHAGMLLHSFVYNDVQTIWLNMAVFSSRALHIGRQTCTCTAACVPVFSLSLIVGRQIEILPNAQNISVLLQKAWLEEKAALKKKELEACADHLQVDSKCMRMHGRDSNKLKTRPESGDFFCMENRVRAANMWLLLTFISYSSE